METSDLTADFIADNQPRRFLVNSVPKSGTTWTRRMITSLPGYQEFPMAGLTGSRPDELAAVQPGEVFHGHLVASDQLWRMLEEGEFATVYVYRDLRDVVVSDYHHRVYLNPDRTPPTFEGRTKEELLMADCLMEWCGSAKRYAEVSTWIARTDIPTIRYEDLLSDCAATLGSALRHLGFVIATELVDQIAEANRFQALAGREAGDEERASPLRKGVAGDWKNHFTEGNTQAFKERFGQLLIDYGYEEDLDW